MSEQLNEAELARVLELEVHETGVVVEEARPDGHMEGHYFGYTETLQMNNLPPKNSLFVRHSMNEAGVHCVSLLSGSDEIAPPHRNSHQRLAGL